jgi:hypothetical protein
MTGKRILMIGPGQFAVSGVMTYVQAIPTGLVIYDDSDRRHLVPIEPPAPVQQRVYGPQRKGRGGKIRRW